MEIIQARRYELIEVLYLLQVCVYELTSGYIYWDPIIPHIEDEIDEGNVFIIKSNHISVGLAVLSDNPENDTHDIDWIEKNKALQINRLSIHPKWAGKGIENELIHFAEQYAKEKGFDSIRIKVFANNKSVIDLTNSLSYKKAGEAHLPLQFVPFIGLEKKIN